MGAAIKATADSRESVVSHEKTPGYSADVGGAGGTETWGVR